MKYYLYISETKVNMLCPQIPRKMLRRIAAELNINVGFFSGSLKTKDADETLYSKVKIISEYLTANHQVGTISHPRSYIQDNLSLKWGILQDYAAGISFFGGVRNNTTIALVGAASSLTGNSPVLNDTSKLSHSLDYYRLRFMNDLIKEDESSAYYPKLKARLEEDDYQKTVRASANAINQLSSPPQPLDFLARVIYQGEEETNKIIVATPIYVAFAE